MDNDDILGLVLERVGSHVSLIRAAAVCRRWRRSIADAAFLRRFRSLHAPAVAGDFYNESILPPFILEPGRVGPVFVPSSGPVFVPSSPSVVDARHFSLDFLPDGARSWNILDSRGSLLLIDRRRFWSAREMIVCEPLMRRFRIIPPPADFGDDYCLLEAFLVDGCYANDAGGRISLSNFRVRCMLRCASRTHTVMFTAAGGTASLWSKKIIDHSAPRFNSSSLGHAGGSWFFYVQGGTLIVLDGSTGDFSSSMLPPLEDWDLLQRSVNFVVTNGRDGMPRIITVTCDNMRVFAKVNGIEWALEKSILLPVAAQGLPGYQPCFFSYPPNVLTRGAGFVVLSPLSWPFSVDLETMEAAPAADMGLMMYRCELPWPPALHACLD